jgi:hypothetical protein
LECGHRGAEMTREPLCGEAIGSTEPDLVDQAFWLPLLGLMAVLFIRCWRGLDITDEMQYYGQILGLVESGRLFSSDLFVQQLVYLLFYPLFKAHHLLFGEVGLVLFGRVVLALLLIALYACVRKDLLKLGAARWPAGLAAFAVTFAVPFHGIFALSYNTVSQVGWVLFILWCMAPAAVSPWRWVALLVVVGFAHPVAAIAMAIVLMALLMQHGEVPWLRWAAAAVCGLVFSVAVLLSFTSWTDLSRALVFSSGFGAVGSGLFAKKTSLYSVLAYAVPMLLLSWALPRMPGLPRQFGLVVGVSLMALMSWAGHRLMRETWTQGYTVPIVQVACLIAVGCVVLTCVRPAASRGALRVLLLISLVHFLVLVGTSSNRLAQGLGALMVLIPLACALVSPSVPGGRPWMAIVTSMAVLSLASLHWSQAPYRDGPWYRLEHSMGDVAAFRHLKVSSPNFQLLDAYRQAVGLDMAGRSALIASEIPGLYFALGVRPQTCMLYMHSARGQASAQVLSSCLRERQPDVILEVQGRATQTASSLQRIIQAEVERRGMSCQHGSLPNYSIFAMPGAPDVAHRLCLSVPAQRPDGPQSRRPAAAHQAQPSEHPR